MSRYCLDTSAYSHFKRGEERVVSLLEAAEWIGVPSIVLGELWMGFLAGGRLERPPPRRSSDPDERHLDRRNRRQRGRDRPDSR